MKQFLSLLFAFFLGVSLFAQNSYTFAPIPYNPDPFASGTNTGIVQDDVWGAPVALPFSFCFFDQSYDTVQIGSNGLVALGAPYAQSSYCTWPINAVLPNSALPAKVICTPWQDLNPSFGGVIRYDVKGVAPYRRFIVSYDSIAMFSCVTLSFSQQVILYETTNEIEFHIRNKPLCATWNGGNASQGVQVSPTQAFVVPGRDYPTQWTATNDGYRFTPVGACAGPPSNSSVAGKVFSDLNANCTQDPGEPSIVNRAVLMNGGQYYAWTDMSGNYAMTSANGNYAVSEMMTGYFLPSNCTPGGVHNLTLMGAPITGVDFADSSITQCVDIAVGMGATFLRRCDTTDILVTYCNNGNMSDSNVVVTVTLVDSLPLLGCSAPYTYLGPNTYQFAVGTLIPGQCGNILLNVRVGCDTAGTIHCLNATIAGQQAVDCNVYNNTDSPCETVLAAFDPNHKYVLARHNGQSFWASNDYESGTDSLTYRIDFQNLGTIAAEDVEVRDYIDTTMLDINTLEVLSASAAFNYVVLGNELIVRFENIHLPDSASDFMGSMGFVKYRIRQRPGHLPCDSILNQARIYFDAEPAVFTNTTVNRIPLPAANLGPDQALCPGASVVLGVQNTYPIYNWSTGANTPTISVSQPGSYTLTVSYPNGCASTDVVTLAASQLIPVFLGNDTTVILTTTLTAPSAVSYLWSTGATTQSIIVTQTGDYTVQVMNGDGCSTSDTIHVTVLTTGVTAPTLADLTVTPQPAGDRVHVQLTLPASQCLRLSILDLAGRERWSRKEICGDRLDTEISLAQFASGTYILRVQGEGMDLSKRVAVMR